MWSTGQIILAIFLFLIFWPIGLIYVIVKLNNDKKNESYQDAYTNATNAYANQAHFDAQRMYEENQKIKAENEALKKQIQQEQTNVELEEA